MPNQARRRRIIKQKRINTKLDTNENSQIDFIDLITTMSRIKHANTVGVSSLSIEELSQIDFDQNTLSWDNDDSETHYLVVNKQ